MSVPGRIGRKVPELTIYFWIVKVLTTAMGEATSDFSVHQIDPVYAVCMGAVAFAIVLGLQLAAVIYFPVLYWAAVVMVAVFGTMCADVLHIRFGVAYQDSAALFAVVLIVVFVAWYLSERTLSIHTIDNRRRELFYWATVLATFALGTAVGDMTATTFHLGYFSSGLLFAGVIAVPAVGYAAFGLNEVFAFWFAYIITRPLGASFADWMGVPRNLGGLDLGRGTVSLMLTGLIAIFVGYLTVSEVDTPVTQRRRPVPRETYSRS